jgi:ATP-dependent exoDNAse (exonuclease V) beta subunit
MEYGKDDPKLAKEIDGMYRRFMQSELMQDVVEDHKEIPYSGIRDDREEVGQIDRLVRKKDGSWFLIDYKAGAPSDDELEEKKARYSEQLKAYAKAIYDMNGIRPRAFLYFTNNGKAVEIDV